MSTSERRADRGRASAAGDDAAEALRALYMFSRNSWIYEMLFARMSSARAADLNTLAEVVEEFTVLRLEPTGEEPGTAGSRAL